MTLKKIILVVAALSFVLFSEQSEARKRRKKFKGPIIVNQILRLNGTMTNNGAPTMEFAGIKEGDVLETGEHSAAVIRIPGLGIYRLGENTKLKLSKFGGRDVTKFELFKGDLLSIYKRLGSHEIKSENASVSPNGNSQSNVFWLADLEKQVAITLWDGKILIKAKGTEPVSKAEISASTVPVDSKQDPPPPVTTLPPPTQFVGELTANTKDALKNYVVTVDKGVIEKEEPQVAPPDSRFIKELESLYALP